MSKHKKPEPEVGTPEWLKARQVFPARSLVADRFCLVHEPTRRTLVQYDDMKHLPRWVMEMHKFDEAIRKGELDKYETRQVRRV